MRPAVLLLVAALAAGCASQPMRTPVAVRLVTDEAEAVLAILDKRARGAAVTDADWSRLFGSEGYRRLYERETSMGRPFEETAFREFVLSEALLARLPELRRTFDAWRRADLSGAGRLALAYLPEGSWIAAKVYPVIKPKTNNEAAKTRRARTGEAIPLWSEEMAGAFGGDSVPRADAP